MPCMHLYIYIDSDLNYIVAKFASIHGTKAAMCKRRVFDWDLDRKKKNERKKPVCWELCYALYPHVTIQTPDQQPPPLAKPEKPERPERPPQNPVYSNVEQNPPVPPRQSHYGRSSPSTKPDVPPVPPRKRPTENGPAPRPRKKTADAQERRVRNGCFRDGLFQGNVSPYKGYK